MLLVACLGNFENAKHNPRNSNEKNESFGDGHDLASSDGVVEIYKEPWDTAFQRVVGGSR